jgi:hypothetical protein
VRFLPGSPNQQTREDIELKVRTTGYTEKTHTIELPHQDIIALMRQDGQKIPSDAQIHIATKTPTSSLLSGLGAMRSPVQRLVLQVVTREEHGA